MISVGVGDGDAAYTMPSSVLDDPRFMASVSIHYCASMTNDHSDSRMTLTNMSWLADCGMVALEAE